MKRVAAVLLAAFVLSGCQSMQTATPKAPVASASAFNRAPIDTTLQGFVQRGQIAGVSALVFKDGREVYFGAFGYADREAQRPMARDTLVQIYSMSKPVTGVALMQLYEQGRFLMDDPLARHLPEFAHMQVYAGQGANGAPILEAPRRPILVRDITRHTAGFAGGGADAGVGPLFAAADPMNWNNTLSEMARRLAAVPLAYHPGEQWRYSPAVDVQAYLVEKLSDAPYERYARDHILAPLGMNETSFFVTPDRQARRAAEYQLSDDGVLSRTPDEEGLKWNSAEWPMDPGGFGWTTTIDDYAKFARMLLNEGELDGVRVLRPETVRMMASNHLDDSITERLWLPNKGQVGFGVDFAVRLRPPANARENPGVVGEFFWDGRDSTLFWVDPENDLTAVLFVQLYPFDRIGLHHDFRGAVYEAVGVDVTE